MLSTLHFKIICKKLRKLRLEFMLIKTIFYQHIKILIKHVFLLNFRLELLMFFEKTLHWFKVYDTLKYCMLLIPFIPKEDEKHMVS